MTRREALFATLGAFVQPESCEIKLYADPLTLTGFGGTRTVYGRSYGPFFLHANSVRVDVTHKPTGLLVAEFPQWADAARFCRAIESLTDWQTLTPATAKVNQELRAAVRKAVSETEGAWTHA